MSSKLLFHSLILTSPKRISHGKGEEGGGEGRGEWAVEKKERRAF